MILGIDPGYHGGIALLSPEGALLDSGRMALARPKPPEYDVRQIAGLARAFLERAQREDEDMALEVVCEAPQHVRIEGVLVAVPTASLWACWGIWAGAFAALGVDVETVAPRTWQAAMLAGVPGATTKAKAKAAAAARWSVSLTEGEADAALLADWRRREPWLVPEASAKVRRGRHG